ncbi:MAG: DUF4838 domain-containing protein [Clostridiales bacterium]|nr:DUF4838 domain-containing protein [Clostridiales bacterium]
MKTFKKILIGICGVMMLGCVAVAGKAISPQEVSASTVTVANEAEYSVYGGAVRVSDATRGPGVKFHVVMTPSKFDTYGTINSDGTGVLDDGVTTGTLLLPYHLTNGQELVVGGTGYGAAVSDSNTSNVWHKKTLGGTEYMQTIVYLYNIPETDFGTAMSVRGYVSVGGNYVYTEQVDGISMSFVAESEYNNKNSNLNAEQKESLKETYLDKTINYHINGNVTTEEVYFENTTLETPTPEATLSDGSTFVGWATKSGKIQKNITSTIIKNHQDFYAMYRKSLVLSSANAQSISLVNYDYDSVVSIKYGSYDLGTNPASLTFSDALKADTQNHGEQNITVTLTKDGKNFTVTMPVLFVTKEISSMKQFADTCRYYGTDIYGYYTLANDIAYTETGFTTTAAATYKWIGEAAGFKGTLDGQGKKITWNGSSYSHGLFGTLYNATVKNVTLAQSWYNGGWGATLIACTAYYSTFENVTITIASGTQTTVDNPPVIEEMGGCTWKNCSMTASASIGTMFKTINKDGKTDTFENVTVNGTITQFAGGFATVNDAPQASVEEVTLAERQDFVLDGDWKILDLDAYNGLEILSVTTSNGETLSSISPFSAKLKLTDLTKHGEQNFYVTVLKADGNKAIVTVPVTVITKEISTMADLQTAVKHTGTNLYGYYVLTNNVAYTEEGYVGQNASYAWNAGTGFKGTLDGRGYTITMAGNNSQHGLFGTLNGATVKNVHIINAWYNGWGASTLGYTVYNTTFENVQITINGNTVSDISSSVGAIVGAEMGGCTWTDVTINVDQAQGTLFKTIHKGGNTDTFENVIVKVPALTQFSDQGTPDGVTIGDVVTLTNTYEFVLDGTNAGKLALGEGYEGATLSKIEYNGTDITSSIPDSLKSDYSLHGTTQTLTAFIENGIMTTKLIIPVTFITKAISTMEELEEAVRYYGTDKNGYYILANDVSYEETGFAWDKAASAAWSATNGFIGTLDGRNHTITLTTNDNNFGYGLFGTFNGVFKNVTINAMNANNYSKSIIARVSCGTVENVTFNIYAMATSDAARAYQNQTIGAMVESAMYSSAKNVWRNVTVIVDTELNFLFPAANNSATFENCTLSAPGYNGINGTTKDVAGWTYLAPQVEEVTLAGNQDLLLTESTFALDLGAYSDITVTAITSGSVDLGTDVSDLANVSNLPLGENTVLVEGKKGINLYEISVPVTVATKAISTMEELEEAVRYYGTDKNGYYILANDVSYEETGFAWDKAASAAWSATNGFIGTLDGRNHTITLTTNDNNFGYGLFGTFNGVLKNVTINAMNANNYSKSIIARVSCGTVENVAFNIYAMATSDAARAYKNQTIGAMVESAMYSNAKNVWRNVTVVVDTEINFLFPAANNSATFENCTLNALGYNGINGTTKDVAGWTFNELGKDVILTDETTQVIDLGITDGNVNSTQTYALNVEGLTAANFISASYNGNPISATGMNLNVADFGKSYGEGTLDIEYYYGEEVRTHSVPVLLVTKMLKSANDVINFLTWADAYNGATGDNIYDGYYALANDIAYNGTYTPKMVVPMASKGDKTIGFKGVFDGMGHTIEGMKVINSNYETSIYGTSDVYRSTAFISILHKEGKIKNVAFTNAQVQFCSYLASWGEGVIENVYVGYTGELANGWNSTVNEMRATGVSPVTMRNCIVYYDTAWTQGQILGKVPVSANAYQNVYVIGPENTKVIEYWNDSTLDSRNYLYPLGDDNFGYYTSMADCLAEHENEICSWGDYFDVDANGLVFNGTYLWEGVASEQDFTGNILISADKTTSDYTIVYEGGNAEALNAATFIAEHIQRATGTVTYAVSDTNKGQIMETVTGGIRLTMTTAIPADWSESSAYIVIGDVDVTGAPKAAAGQYIIKTNGNTAFIHADIDEEYITAAMAFLEEAIGYKALSDDTVYYDKVNGSAVAMPEIDVDYDSAFNVRNSTNAYYTWKNDQMGLNGRYHFSIGPINEYGNVAAFHNSIYWLDYETNSSTHAAWFRTSSGVVDVCYAAGGQQNESNAEYVAMVATAATNMRAILNANPGKTDISFSLMDNDMTGCTCSVCAANRTNAAITFLNDVVAKIQEQDGHADRAFRIFILAYYYLIDAPTVDMNEHLGVIYAPVRMNSYEAKSIYDSANDGIREDIQAWLQKTKNIGFWFYGTLYHNYMIFTDTYESMLTWWEFAARTVKNAGGEITWVYQNGQNRQMAATAFEDFKHYVVSKAQVEILNKVTVDGSDANYSAQIKAYLLELESEFFGFTVNGSTKTFKDGGYYGPAAANEAMYNMYTQMKSDYAGIEGNNDGTIYEDIDTIKYSNWIFTAEANRLNDYIAKGKTDGYWGNYTSEMITRYMGYVETAQNAINSYTGSMKTLYSQHILVESLSPRFMICVAGGSDKSNYGFADGYNGTNITTLRTNLKADLTALGMTYYGEHYKFDDLYTNWGI